MRPRRRSALHWRLWCLTLVDALIAVSTLAMTLLLGAAIRSRYEAQTLLVARVSCQTLLLARPDIERMQFGDAGMTCRLWLQDGQEVVLRWEGNMWVKERRL